MTSKVDGEDEEVAHGANGTTTASARKTAPHRRIPSYYEFPSHTVLLDVVQMSGDGRTRPANIRCGQGSAGRTLQ